MSRLYSKVDQKEIERALGKVTPMAGWKTRTTSRLVV
jgi:hypothetical protein